MTKSTNKLNVVLVQEARSLSDFLYHDNEDVQKAVFEHFGNNNGEGLLLLLEGYDELPKQCFQDSFLYYR